MTTGEPVTVAMNEDFPAPVGPSTYRCNFGQLLWIRRHVHGRCSSRGKQSI